MSTVRNVILFFLFFLLVWLVLHTGVNRAEEAECIGWIEMSEEYPNFHLVDWQAEQCETLGFDISTIERR